MGTRGRGGLKESGREGGPAFQKRGANDQERKFESRNGKKYISCKEGGDKCTKRNKISRVRWTRIYQQESFKGDILIIICIDTFPITPTRKHYRKCLEY